MHPLVRARAAELAAAVPDDAVVVHDVPLLVETGQAGSYDLVLVVRGRPGDPGARGSSSAASREEDARARIAAQATDEQRRAVADVVLDNSGTEEELAAQVDRFWAERVRRRRLSSTADVRAATPGAARRARPGSWRPSRPSRARPARSRR